MTAPVMLPIRTANSFINLVVSSVQTTTRILVQWPMDNQKKSDRK